MGVLSAGEHIFNETAMCAEGQQSYGKSNQSKSWSKSDLSFSGKCKSEENKGKSKGKSKGTKSVNQGAKGLHRQNIESWSLKS